MSLGFQIEGTKGYLKPILKENILIRLYRMQ